MESHTVLLALRIALLVVLWLFVFIAVRSLAKTVLASRGSIPRSTAQSPARTAQPITRLVFTSGSLTGRYLNLAGVDTATLGRAADCFVRVTDDFASSHHARLFRTAAGWFVEDLASRNGTMVDGRPIESPEQVRVGSEITIGQTTVRLAP